MRWHTHIALFGPSTCPKSEPASGIENNIHLPSYWELFRKYIQIEEVSLCRLYCTTCQLENLVRPHLSSSPLSFLSSCVLLVLCSYLDECLDQSLSYNQTEVNGRYFEQVEEPFTFPPGRLPSRPHRWVSISLQHSLMTDPCQNPPVCSYSVPATPTFSGWWCLVSQRVCGDRRPPPPQHLTHTHTHIYL